MTTYSTVEWCGWLKTQVFQHFWHDHATCNFLWSDAYGSPDLNLAIIVLSTMMTDLHDYFIPSAYMWGSNWWYQGLESWSVWITMLYGLLPRHVCNRKGSPICKPCIVIQRHMKVTNTLDDSAHSYMCHIYNFHVAWASMHMTVYHRELASMLAEIASYV